MQFHSHLCFSCLCFWNHIKKKKLFRQCPGLSPVFFPGSFVILITNSFCVAFLYGVRLRSKFIFLQAAIQVTQYHLLMTVICPVSTLRIFAENQLVINTGSYFRVFLSVPFIHVSFLEQYYSVLTLWFCSILWYWVNDFSSFVFLFKNDFIIQCLLWLYPTFRISFPYLWKMSL